MTISKRVQIELVLATPSDADVAALVVANPPKRITKTLLKTSRDAKSRREAIAARTKGQAWTPEEHARFLEALQIFPSGPWEAVAEYVGTKNSRQTMTHAQKYRQKHERQQRGLRVQPKPKKKRTPAREAAAPYPPVKKEDEHDDTELRISTLAPVEYSRVEVESPRSGEDENENEQLLPPIDLDLFNSSTMLNIGMDDATAPFKFDSASILEHLFTDFEPHAQALHLWSTNSLMDKLEELSTLPDDFSQTLGLWVP